jgi:catechol 2,3-dioxygenase-like lactoylglutathione lyase family enzyme
MATLSFDHIHYRYSDQKAITDFYVDIMGAIDLGPVYLNKKPNLQFELGGATLLFAFEGEKPVTPVTADEKLGVYHIAFLVPDCVAATAYYESRGAVVKTPPFKASENIKASFLYAPDGMLVELKEITKSSIS